MMVGLRVFGVGGLMMMMVGLPAPDPTPMVGLPAPDPTTMVGLPAPDSTPMVGLPAPDPTPMPALPAPTLIQMPAPPAPTLPALQPISDFALPPALTLVEIRPTPKKQQPDPIYAAARVPSEAVWRRNSIPEVSKCTLHPR